MQSLLYALVLLVLVSLPAQADVTGKPRIIDGDMEGCVVWKGIVRASGFTVLLLRAARFHISCRGS